MRALREPHATWVAVAAVAAAGVVLRVWVYRSDVALPDSDEAIVGLMARHLLHGEITTFYWGQPYGGPQEAWLAAPTFALFGSSLLTLRLVPMALVALACVLVWRISVRTGGRSAGMADACVLVPW